jgi:hypothetical protein
MNKEFVEEFSFLLDSQSDGVEVSYNAAGTGIPLQKRYNMFCHCISFCLYIIVSWAFV